MKELTAIEKFKQFLEQEQKYLEYLPQPLQALWYDKKGDWNKAHEIVEDAKDADSAWVHAYLHREEGDLSNARYWYKRSDRPESQGSLTHEWEQIASCLLMKVK